MRATAAMREVEKRIVVFDMVYGIKCWVFGEVKQREDSARGGRCKYLMSDNGFGSFALGPWIVKA